MSDIFISYANEDGGRAKVLAESLGAQGWSVWWDPDIPAGSTFRDDVIEEALGKAKCVVVMWSRHSVGSRWVKTEAAEGAKRGILVPVLIEDVQIPLAFRRIQAENLINWDGTPTSQVFQKLLADIANILSPSPIETKEAPTTSQTTPSTPPIAVRKPVSGKPNGLARGGGGLCPGGGRAVVRPGSTSKAGRGRGLAAGGARSERASRN